MPGNSLNFTGDGRQRSADGVRFHAPHGRRHPEVGPPKCRGSRSSSHPFRPWQLPPRRLFFSRGVGDRVPPRPTAELARAKGVIVGAAVGADGVFAVVLDQAGRLVPARRASRHGPGIHRMRRTFLSLGDRLALQERGSVGPKGRRSLARAAAFPFFRASQPVTS